MKYYKITLGKAPGGSLIYPDRYQEEIGNFAVDHLYWDEGQQPYLMLCIPDAVANVPRAGIEEITEEMAKSISEANEPRIEKVNDEVKLRRLELKATLGQALSQDELNAVEKGHPDSVFTDVKILADRIDDIKSK